MNEPSVNTRPHPLERLGNLLSFLGLATFSLAAFGKGKPLEIARQILGAFPEPGLLLPNDVGARKFVPVYAALAFNRKYVNYTEVSKMNHNSPVRCTFSFGLAGDFDDYTALMAFHIVSVGGRARIVHAWAGLWLGRDTQTKAVLEAVARGAGRGRGGIQTSGGREMGKCRLPLGYRPGVFSPKGCSREVAGRNDT